MHSDAFLFFSLEKSPNWVQPSTWGMQPVSGPLVHHGVKRTGLYWSLTKTCGHFTRKTTVNNKCEMLASSCEKSTERLLGILTRLVKKREGCVHWTCLRWGNITRAVAAADHFCYGRGDKKGQTHTSCCEPTPWACPRFGCGLQANCTMLSPEKNANPQLFNRWEKNLPSKRPGG